MAENKQNTTPERRPDCVTEIRMGNTVLVVSGFFKKAYLARIDHFLTTN